MKDKFLNVMVMRGFSKNTIENYMSIFNAVITENSNIFSDTEDNIIAYLSKKILKNNFSQSYVAQHVSVFNIIIKSVLKRSETIKIPRPKKKVKQPDILSYEEMNKIFSAITNIKHKAIIAIMYSTGLRVSEACNLKIKDIDTTNGFISVRHAKGGNDRKVMLDPIILNYLRQYYIEYKPNNYLFVGAKGGEYSNRSVQIILGKAVKKVGINKSISTHSLRHSCFTQLLRNGVDIRSIQRLAGHKNISTTASYLHITDNDVLNIASPIRNISL